MFDKFGKFLNEVEFEFVGLPGKLNINTLKLVHFSICKQYFVFEGKEIKEKIAEPAPANLKGFSINRETEAEEKAKAKADPKK